MKIHISQNDGIQGLLAYREKPEKLKRRHLKGPCLPRKTRKAKMTASKDFLLTVKNRKSKNDGI
ncbi:hypothetical protein NLX69_03200 [Rossellomorea sp. BNER]|nr:hypothetical protein [Rossellomorea sp. BNER]